MVTYDPFPLVSFLRFSDCLIDVRFIIPHPMIVYGLNLREPQMESLISLGAEIVSKSTNIGAEFYDN